MRMVTSRTGLSPHVIRVWERRYGAVKPIRTPTNRRVYREEDVERLRLLHQATLAGHSIGQASKLSNERLKSLVADLASAAPPLTSPAASRSAQVGQAATERCLEAVKLLNVQALTTALESAVLKLGVQGLLTRVAAPLAQRVGELWRAGEITAAQEHFVSAALRTFLGRHAQQFVPSAQAPVIVVATPTGQIHELGAVLVAAAAGNVGWKVVYLGASLPAAEMAGVAGEKKARAVALSLVYPEDDPSLPRQLRELREYLPQDVEIIVGGRAAPAYAATLVEIGARVAHTLEDLFPALDAVRSADRRN